VSESPETGIVIDTSQFPVVVAWFGRVFSDADWERALTKIELLAAGRMNFVVLNVTRADMATPTAAQRKAVADFNTAYIAAGYETLLGWGTVIKSHVLRGVLTAITWITTFPYEQRALANLDEGLAWADQLLKQAKR
jgi:hypothetical protein